MKTEKRGLLKKTPQWWVVAAVCLLGFVAMPSFANCFKDNGDGTLTDPNTGLIWQTCALGQSWDGKSCNGKVSELNWNEALLAADADWFLGKEDWILPTKVQVESALKVHCEQWKGRFWSSSPYAGNSSVAWGVGFVIGYVSYDFRCSNYAVRLVRASQLSDIGIFKASLAQVPEPMLKPHIAFKSARLDNTVAA
ncbi:MAG: DUF1566 domain-containing protein [Pseudomonadota bacterium]|nr:DUF1566 domain-containing protein [Pseudomonadota bacterium]MDP1905209.1 DUF1566 domain-containing protein [Pseudomonadota bacterium]MDP2352771.1 DUF1566 domain-containing protein [Pseudomonadota bacterium]